MKKISPKQFDLITTLLKHLGLEDVVPENFEIVENLKTILKEINIKRDRYGK